MNANIPKAVEDMDDILKLRRCSGFDRYFLRRLRERQKALEALVLRGEMTQEDREIHRRVYLEYDEIIGMIDRDEAAAARLLEKR